MLLLGIGIWLIVDKHAVSSIAEAAEKTKMDDLKDLADEPRAVRSIGIILAVGGAVVVLIAFLGCCGAVKEWRPLLILASHVTSRSINVTCYASAHSAV